MPDSRFDGSLFNEPLFDERPEYGSETTNVSVAAATAECVRGASAATANESEATAAPQRVRWVASATVNRSVAHATMPLAPPQSTNLVISCWARPTLAGSDIRVQEWASLALGAGLEVRGAPWLGPRI